MKQKLQPIKLIYTVLMLILFNQATVAETSIVPTGNQDDVQLLSLNQLEWERRLILVKTENAEKIKPIFLKHKDAIDERNISWFIISKDKLHSNHSQIADDKLVIEVQSILNYFQDDTFVLIGYDGEIKSTDNGLNIARVFEQIDAMPMRQLEMSRQ